MFGGRSAASLASFGDVARALADFLESRGVLDVVPSDIVTGLIVLQRLQRQRVYAARLQFLEALATILPNESGIIEGERPDDVVVVQTKNKPISSSTIRKRVSSINLDDQGEVLIGSADIPRSEKEDLLLPAESVKNPVNKAPQRSRHHSLLKIDQRPLPRPQTLAAPGFWLWSSPPKTRPYPRPQPRYFYSTV